jgi:hypothetical protein
MSSILLTNSALKYKPKCGGGGGSGGGLSQWIQLYTGGQINFGDLTYAYRAPIVFAYRAPIGSLLFQNSYWLPSGGVTCLMNPVYTVAETQHALELTKPKVHSDRLHHRVHIFTGLVYLPTQLERTLQLYW